MFDLDPEFLEVELYEYDSSLNDVPPEEYVHLSYNHPETKVRHSVCPTLRGAVGALRQKLWEDELRKEVEN